MTEVRLDIDALRHEGTEIARYRVAAGQRLLMGRRASGGAEIVDLPASGKGRAYYVDRGYTDGALLVAFVNDYLKQAARLDACPMSREAIGTMLRHSEEDELVSMMLDAA